MWTTTASKAKQSREESTRASVEDIDSANALLTFRDQGFMSMRTPTDAFAAGVAAAASSSEPLPPFSTKQPTAQLTPISSRETELDLPPSSQDSSRSNATALVGVEPSDCSRLQPYVLSRDELTYAERRAWHAHLSPSTRTGGDMRCLLYVEKEREKLGRCPCAIRPQNLDATRPDALSTKLYTTGRDVRDLDMFAEAIRVVLLRLSRFVPTTSTVNVNSLKELGILLSGRVEAHDVACLQAWRDTSTRLPHSLLYVYSTDAESLSRSVFFAGVCICSELQTVLDALLWWDHDIPGTGLAPRIHFVTTRDSPR